MKDKDSPKIVSSGTAATPIAFCRNMPQELWERHHEPLSKNPLILGALVFFWVFGCSSLLMTLRVPPILSVTIVVIVLLGGYLFGKSRQRYLREILIGKGLPTCDLSRDRFVVIDDPVNWQLPTEVPPVEFEKRNYAAHIQGFWEMLPLAAFLVPGMLAIAIANLRDGDYLIAITSVGLLTILPPLSGSTSSYEIRPGHMRTMMSRRFGRAVWASHNLNLSNAVIVADFVRERILIFAKDETIDFHLRGIADKREFVFYLMLASRSRDESLQS